MLDIKCQHLHHRPFSFEVVPFGSLAFCDFHLRIFWKKAEICIFRCSTLQINPFSLLLPPFLVFSSLCVHPIKSFLWFPLQSCHLSVPPHISPFSWLLFNPLLFCLSGFIPCNFPRHCSLLLLFCTSWLLPVMWGMCYVISPLKCALARSPFPCCARWIIYVNYSIERYALSTTGDLSADPFLLLCMYMCRLSCCLKLNFLSNVLCFISPYVTCYALLDVSTFKGIIWIMRIVLLNQNNPQWQNWIWM